MGEDDSSQKAKCPPEILLLIFEQLHRNAPASCGAVRLASNQSKALIDPIFYRHLKLNKALVKCFDLDDASNVSQDVVDARKRIASAICSFTRQITIDRALNWSLVVSLLLSLNQFHHLNWHFWETEGYFHHARPSQTLQSISSSMAKRWPSAKLSVNGLSSSHDAFNEFKSLPFTTNLVSLKQGISPLSRGSLKMFLLQCDQLNVLHFYNLRSGAGFLDEEIGQSERLPPIEELFLQGYDWRHCPSIASSFWNWSGLTSLRLEKVSIISFLESVSPENFLQLRSLITDGHCQNPAEYNRATNLMIKLLRAIDSLETLSLVCSVSMFPIDVIRKHGPGLRHLQLRDFNRMVHLPLRRDRVTTLSLHGLLDIQASCPSLMELGLDVDQGVTSSSFTSLLLEWRNLRRLTFSVQQPFLSGVDLNNEQELCPHMGKRHFYPCLNRSCQEYENIEVGVASNFVDRTYEATCTFFQDQLLRKQGAAFERLTMRVVGYDDLAYPEVLSAEGQRQQLWGNSHERTFVYEPRQVNGRPVIPFEKQLVRETTAKRTVKTGGGQGITAGRRPW